MVAEPLQGGQAGDRDDRRLLEGEVRRPGRKLVLGSARVLGVMGGGAKVYFRERAFVRTDVRFTFDGDRQNVTFRAGVGFDF